MLEAYDENATNRPSAEMEAEVEVVKNSRFP
jgi:hypothetical protein